MTRFLSLIFLLLHAVLIAGIPADGRFCGPSEQLVRRHSLKIIWRKLNRRSLSKSLIPYAKVIASSEKWGHVGYHGATQDYRVYQDVIRFTIEEVMKIPIREDFYFLRIPGDSTLNFDSADEFIAYWGEELDNYNGKARYLLSLTFGLYTNFNHRAESPLYLFGKGISKSVVDYRKELGPFYEELGISPGVLKNIFAIAKKWLNKRGGILIQLSDTSHLDDPQGQAYSFADTQCYPAVLGGRYWGPGVISKQFEWLMTEDYVEKKIDIAPQFRLIINNRYTLNPFLHFSMVRWDFYDPETIALYEAEMREYIKNLRFDPDKVQQYKVYLLKLWSEGLQSHNERERLKAEG